ncbi:hypothetical protein IRZ81_14540 [Pseudomonas putida]|uniref:hypothetical protein n=1 Tax=Pseudomonas putida TaxID=303 RepID=UPI0018AAF207|nr:hypothetical protein [Pseudomonas putida]MBF8652013.1 hypothetical protein [Pseudomonas putida]MBF8655965.1 hypothetical protein [Pseudomonas putida]
MPTENRSSTIEQHDHVEGIIDMVSVPREIIEFAAGLKWHAYKSGTEQKDDQLQALSKLRAILAKPSPQPHADPIAWMVGTAIWWTKEEAERDAAAMGLPVVNLGPCAGLGDHERLRTELVESDLAFVRASTEAEQLRAQLAERDELLRELADAPPAAMELRLQQKVKAALSASAEPQVKP